MVTLSFLCFPSSPVANLSSLHFRSPLFLHPGGISHIPPLPPTSTTICMAAVNEGLIVFFPCCFNFVVWSSRPTLFLSLVFTELSASHSASPLLYVHPYIHIYILGLLIAFSPIVPYIRHSIF
ncbi:hypothetical protein BDN72DRAFT_334487 [Pluteus cervinus]|uniref:Uncharacterized protein n=1 Tax=Pluteus cervinus TaxID=181527 RepID=A0ACD3B2U8_9AGAR|nr:hypothetical protein BDN72DRAFT_334487 [Pluteus cervinus]